MYKVQITDMETGETLINCKSDCIMGAVNDCDSDGIQRLFGTACNGFDCVLVYAAVKAVLEQAKEKIDTIRIMEALGEIERIVNLIRPARIREEAHAGVAETGEPDKAEKSDRTLKEIFDKLLSELTDIKE